MSRPGPGGTDAAVNHHFSALREGLASHLSALQATDWAGQRKEGAVTTVSAYTRSAQTNCQTAESSITTYIASQLESVLAADKPVA